MHGGPPSDQPLNTRSPAVRGAASEAVVPRMSVRANGVIAVPALSSRGSPGGAERSANSTVRGKSAAVAVSFMPSASVAVSRTSRWAGYSCPGAVIVRPGALPVPRGCSWQSVGQCSKKSPQLSASSSSSMPSSVAPPDSTSGAPALQRGGTSSDATGGSPPAAIVTAAVAVAPCGSATRSRTS